MIFTSPYPSVEIPDVSLPSYVLRRAAALGDKPALVDGPSGRTVTYRQLLSAVGSVASGLHQRGLKKGEVFAIYAPNIPEYAIAFHAVGRLGAVCTTANPLYTAEELAFQLNDSGARFLLTIPQLLDKAQEAAAHSKVEEVFVFGEAAGATPFASLMSSEPAPEVAINPAEDVVAMPYSSGTTGVPKGVMLTHRNLVANLCQCVTEPMNEQDTLIGILPLYHIYGMELILNLAVASGSTVVTMPRFDMEQFLSLMQDYGVTRAYVAPPLVLALAKHPLVDKYKLDKLKVVMSGAAPLSAALAIACAERLGCNVKQGYGMTETSPVTHINPDESELIKQGSIGVPMPLTEVKVVDPESGRELGAGETGEICIRGPQVMKGYLNNPAATASMIEPDGWLHTGDLGYADADGYFYIVDRLKELIKYKGFQVAPAELEAILLTHPAVADAAVIPVADEEAGEVPKAYVVLRGEATPEQIMAYVAGRVSPQKRVRLLEVTDVIPKSSSGKILRRVLREQERARQQPQIADTSDGII